MSFEEGRLLAALIPGAELVPLEGENHVLIPDDPAFEGVAGEIISFLARGTDEARPRATLPEDLTPRELQVLELIAQGLDNSAIAGELHLSAQSCDEHPVQARCHAPTRRYRARSGSGPWPAGNRSHLTDAIPRAATEPARRRLAEVELGGPHTTMRQR